MSGSERRTGAHSRADGRSPVLDWDDVERERSDLHGRFEEVVGQCFDWAYRHITKTAQDDARLVHGWIEHPKQGRMQHGWIEFQDRVFDFQTTIMGRFLDRRELKDSGWSTSDFYATYKPTQHRAYGWEEAILKAADNTGPWE